MDVKKGMQTNTFFEVEVPNGLCEAILARVALARRRAAQLRIGTLGIIAGLCGAALVPALQYAAGEFYASGFGDYLSLLSSDRGFVLASWRDVVLSLLEALPSLALLILLALGSVLVWSLLRLLRTAPVAFTKVRV